MAKNLIRFDWALKRLLRDKANFGILEGFLSELLKFDVFINKIGESEGNQETIDDKFNRVDILAHTHNDEIIIIELQVNSELDYFHRILYGVSKAIGEHMYLGGAYEEVKKVYSINIVYFDLGQGKDYVYHGKNQFRGLHYDDILLLNSKQKAKYSFDEVYKIYPEYYILKMNGFNDISKDTLDEWIYFLKNNEIKDEFKARGLKEAKEKLGEDDLNDTEMAAYKQHIQNVMLTNSLLDTAKFEGKIEEKIETVKNCLLDGLSLEQTSRITKLSIEEVSKISKELNTNQ